MKKSIDRKNIGLFFFFLCAFNWEKRHATTTNYTKEVAAANADTWQQATIREPIKNSHPMITHLKSRKLVIGTPRRSLLRGLMSDPWQIVVKSPVDMMLHLYDQKILFEEPSHLHE